MSLFSKLTPRTRAEEKATFLALFVTLTFIALLSVVFPRSERKKEIRSNSHVAVPAPLTPSKLLEVEPPAFADANEQFRVIPEHFKNVDFKNHSYLLYDSPGIAPELILSDGRLQLPENTGWFAWRDVHYKDVTGDGKAEAIVRLTRVKCNRSSCDGGADLFYVYAIHKGKLTTLWQYQAGSRGYGCSLKSLTVTEKQLVLELFGQCPNEGTHYPEAVKFLISDLTFTLFEFDGRRFVKKATEFVITGARDVRNYEPSIHLY
jgi:hypothetical protein